MTLKEKQTLVRLLEIYKNEMVEQIEADQKALKKVDGDRWSCNIKQGCKAQYIHARTIITRLAVEIEKELPSYWDM